MANDPLLFELKPAADTDSLLLTTAVGQLATGTVWCSNQAELLDFIGVAIVPNGDTLSAKSWILFETKAFSGLPITLQQICLGSGDSIYVKSLNGTTAFVFTGTTF